MKKIVYFLCSTLLLLGIAQAVTGCKKFTPFSLDHLSFSKDTVVFDTVFTTIGSTTQQFKIYNPSNKSVKIEQIELMGGRTLLLGSTLTASKGHPWKQW